MIKEILLEIATILFVVVPPIFLMLAIIYLFW
jgi:hypothetical protein